MYAHLHYLLCQFTIIMYENDIHEVEIELILAKRVIHCDTKDTTKIKKHAEDNTRPSHYKTIFKVYCVL